MVQSSHSSASDDNDDDVKDDDDDGDGEAPEEEEAAASLIEVEMPKVEKVDSEFSNAGYWDDSKNHLDVDIDDLLADYD